MRTTYPVNEIFETIQGEATFTGTPSIFIRMQGCPVGCAWCDTKHTWYMDNTDNTSVREKTVDSPSYEIFTSEQLLNELRNYTAKHIVITGGEPCLYNLKPITTMLIKHGYSVQIETSGTHEIKCHADTWVTVSPKIGMKMPVIKSALDRANEIKHPVGKQKDIDNLLSLNLNNKKLIWLQPLSLSKKATELCMTTAIKRNWKLSVQTHKFIQIR